MKAVSKILIGGAALATLAGAAPAAAQYYPNYPSPYGYGYGQGYGQSGLGAIIDQLLGGRRYAYGVDQRALVDRCVAAVTNRIDRSYSYNRRTYPYGGYGNYYGGRAQVLGITNIDPDRRELQVRGVATANAMPVNYGPYGNPYGGYGNPYGGYGYAQPVGELTFRCDIDYRGRVTDIDLNRNRNAYNYPYRRY